ncbi:hypothetical protein GBA52_004136, partial [Prunus armeniaca]
SKPAFHLNLVGFTHVTMTSFFLLSYGSEHDVVQCFLRRPKRVRNPHLLPRTNTTPLQRGSRRLQIKQ